MFAIRFLERHPRVREFISAFCFMLLIVVAWTLWDAHWYPSSIAFAFAAGMLGGMVVGMKKADPTKPPFWAAYMMIAGLAAVLVGVPIDIARVVFL